MPNRVVLRAFVVRAFIALVGATFAKLASAQTVCTSDSSLVSFASETPIERIKGLNHASTAVIEMSARTVKIQVPVAAFRFDNRLMQEHFQEGYLEPKKFPFATFRGKLSDSLDLSIDTVYQVQATGMLNVHGTDRVRTFDGVITCKDSVAALRANFDLVLADHEVKVPGAVFENIAKMVKVEVYFRLLPFREEEGPTE